MAHYHGRNARQIFALARAGCLSEWLAKAHPRFKTPHRAILAGGVVGIAAVSGVLTTRSQREAAPTDALLED